MGMAAVLAVVERLRLAQSAGFPGSATVVVVVRGMFWIAGCGPLAMVAPWLAGPVFPAL